MNLSSSVHYAHARLGPEWGCTIVREDGSDHIAVTFRGRVVRYTVFDDLEEEFRILIDEVADSIRRGCEPDFRFHLGVARPTAAAAARQHRGRPAAPVVIRRADLVAAFRSGLRRASPDHQDMVRAVVRRMKGHR